MRSLRSLSSILVVAALASCSRDPVTHETAKKTQARSGTAEPVAATESEAPDEPTRLDQPVAEPAAEESAAIEQASGESAAIISDRPPAKAVSPQVWARLHRIALQPGSPGWNDAIQALQTVGDGFTVEHLKRIKVEKLTKEGRDLLRSSVAAIEERVSHEDEQTSAELVLPRLERAAYCDLTCNPLETVLVQWTLTKLRSQAHLPQVRARLEEIGAHYQPDVNRGSSDAEPEQMFGAMSDRVPLYVSRILDKSVR